MTGLFGNSIGKKLIMSLTGLFLILFLLVHLTINLFLLAGDGELFNRAAHFMATNPIVRIVEPLLAVGFVVHILYATVLTLKNRRTRPVGYAVTASNGLSTWSSRNMYVLGGAVFIFLVVHLINFFWRLKFGEVPTIIYDGEEMSDAYALVSGLFIRYWWYDILYVAGSVLLAFHLSHGFWSAFQTLGWNGTRWMRRLEIMAYLFAVIVGLGFSSIPLYFLIFK